MMVQMYVGRSNMRAAFLAMLLVMCSPVAPAQTASMIDFFRHADSMTIHPSLDQQLAIIQQKKMGDNYVSFVGPKGTSIVLLAAVTVEKLADPNLISRTVDFIQDRPTTGKIPTWGYVFDRNRDGKIDYLALVEGAAPYKNSSFPADYPARKKRVDMAQMELFVNNCKLVFNHYADDNYDGKIDALVHIDLDPERDWVDRQIVARSTQFNDLFDVAWAFQGSMANEHVTVGITTNGILFHPLNRPTDYLSKATLADRTGILNYLNASAAECKLKWFNFIHPEKKDE